MRITSNYYHTIMAQVTRQGNAGLSDVLIRMATEQRILRPSDDPVGAMRLAQLSQADEKLDQYRGNIASLSTRMQRSEGVLSGLVKNFDQVKDTMVLALDGGRSPEDLNSYAQVLESVRDIMLQAANSRDSSGNYMYSGTAITTAPIAFDPSAPAGSRYSFAGNEGKQQVAVGDGVTEVANDSLAEMADALNALDEAIGAMTAPGADPNDPAYRELLGRAQDRVTAASAAVEQKIGRLGNAQNTLEMMSELHTSTQIIGNQAAIDVGRVDRNEVYGDYQNYMVAVQATQKVYAQVTQLTLFNVL
jgi:flagellar hook-associated protein 3 FlgL